jgi:hypothetical protein
MPRRHILRRSLRFAEGDGNSQLAVVHGLVLERAQEIGKGIKPIRERCARVSYGLVVNQPYNPMKHVGEQVVKDPRDKKKWAIGQVEWLIQEASTTSA